jgi:hypothetical protein
MSSGHSGLAERHAVEKPQRTDLISAPGQRREQYRHNGDILKIQTIRGFAFCDYLAVSL